MNYNFTRTYESYVVVEDTLKVSIIEISTFPVVEEEVTRTTRSEYAYVLDEQ